MIRESLRRRGFGPQMLPRVPRREELEAHRLEAAGRVAILDLDFHHGKGTQEIFYASSEVL